MLLICSTYLISSTSVQHYEQIYTRKWFYSEYTSLYCDLLLSKELLIWLIHVICILRYIRRAIIPSLKKVKQSIYH